MAAHALPAALDATHGPPQLTTHATVDLSRIVLVTYYEQSAHHHRLSPIDESANKLPRPAEAAALARESAPAFLVAPDGAGLADAL